MAEDEEKFQDMSGSDRKYDRKRIRDLSVYELARIAGCPFEPQTSDSGDGAAFLNVCREYALDAIHEYDLSDGIDDAVLETADRCIPTHTYTKWITWVELGGYREPDPDHMGIEGFISDASRLPNTAMLSWAWHIIVHIFGKMGYDY